jgi:hypothetical protein
MFAPVAINLLKPSEKIHLSRLIVIDQAKTKSYLFRHKHSKLTNLKSAIEEKATQTNFNLPTKDTIFNT